MPDQHRYTREDLVEATISARRWRHAAPELRDWHVTRHQALLAAFGEVAVAPEQAAPGWIDQAQIGPDASKRAQVLIDAVMSALDGLRSPFSGFLEAPPIVHAFYVRYATPVNRCTAEYHDLLRRLLGELLGLRDGIPTSAVVTAEDLRRHGFDPDVPAPDPDDFW